MASQWSRRGFLGLAGTAGVVAAGATAGCSADSAGHNSDGTVTITHLFGETTIAAPPKRVVSAGYTGQDDLLAVGVVPVAVTNWFGDQPFAVWPWAQPKLGTATPVVLNMADGIPVEQIAALKPDLIVATNAGVDADTYQRLSAIAPTLPQSDGDAFFEPWRDQATAIGEAVFQAEKMTSLIAEVDAKFAQAAKSNPGFEGKKAMLLDGQFRHRSLGVWTGWRTEFLTQLGLQVIDSADTVDVERIKTDLGAADVLIWTTNGDEDRAALLTNPDIAVLQERSVFTTAEQAGAIAFASPLSYPVVADQLPPLIGQVLR